MNDTTAIIIFCLGMALFLSLLMHYRDWMDRPNLNPGDRFAVPPPPDIDPDEDDFGLPKVKSTLPMPSCKAPKDDFDFLDYGAREICDYNSGPDVMDSCAPWDEISETERNEWREEFRVAFVAMKNYPAYKKLQFYDQGYQPISTGKNPVPPGEE